jgi:ubiquinone/menaquinone biosynthesis C-methylase UbiE
MGCCDRNEPIGLGTPKDAEADPRQDTLDQVRDGYARIAEQGSLSAAASGGCCGAGEGGTSPEALAEQIGYSAEAIEALPEGANMGLSCGNPTAIAALQPGQTVLDLGSGGGFDCFLAGPKVGAEGRVIGVDMTPQMLTKARQGLPQYEQSTGLSNVEFRLGEIEHLPAADQSVDVVISNCVINLSPDKPQVWREIQRILRPGGRVAASDMALFKPLPEAVAEQLEALIGCVAGAVPMDTYQAMLERAGFEAIQLTPKPEYIQALADFKDPMYETIVSALPAGESLGDYVTSLDVQAVKPAGQCCG